MNDQDRAYVYSILNWRFVNGYATAYLFFQGERRKVKIAKSENGARHATLAYVNKELILYGSKRQAYLAHASKELNIGNFTTRINNKPGGIKIGKTTFWLLGERNELRLKRILPEA